MPEPSVTIFIPTYNGQAFINSCIESAINQNYSNYNIVILDSGSTDNTLKQISDYKNRGVEIIIRETPARLNIFENWHRILDCPKNEWLTILGQDDMLDPSYLKEMAALIQTYSDHNLFYAHYHLIEEQGIRRRSSKPMPVLETSAEFVKNRFAGTRDSFATGYMIRSEAYVQCGGISNYPDLLFADDALWVSLSLNKPMVISPLHLFSYRFHFGSTSGTPHQERLTDAGKQYLEFLLKASEEYPEIGEILKKYSRIQFLPILRGYYCLASLFYTSQNKEIPQVVYNKLKTIAKLTQINEVEIFNLKCKAFKLINTLPFKAFIGGIIFKIIPSLQHKARF